MTYNTDSVTLAYLLKVNCSTEFTFTIVKYAICCNNSHM